MRSLTSIPLLLLATSTAAQTTWEMRAALTTARGGAAVAVLDGEIYVIGGRNGAGYALDVVERYDPGADDWEPVGRLREARYNAAAAVFEGQIVLAGGRDEDNRVIDDVEAYNPLEDRWESFDSLEYEREGLALFAVSEGLYAFGGLGEGGAFRDDCEVYYSRDDYWEPYAPWTLEVARASFGAVPTGDGVIVIGGYSAVGPVADVERYVPGSGGTIGTSLPERRGGLAASAVPGGRIWAVGGKGEGGIAVARVDIYDPTSDTWAPGLALPEPREGAVAATVEGTLYVIGGRDEEGTPVATTYAISGFGTPGEEDPTGAPTLALGPPSPNPSAGPVRLALDVAGMEPVAVEVLDALGRRVAVVYDGPLGPGRHALTWSGHADDGRPFAPGVYVVRARQGGAHAARRVTVVR